MKKTKEELLLENSKLEQSIKRYYDEDIRLRRQFSVIFNWFDSSSHFSSDRKPREISWEVIFTEIGKLLAIKQTIDESALINDLELKISDLNHRLMKENKDR